MRKFMLIAVFSAVCSGLGAQKIEMGTVPREILYTHHNDDFTVCVRVPGGDWQDLYEYRVMVDMDSPQPASMVQFDFEGKVELRVKLNNGILNEVAIRPLHKNIPHTRDENHLYFTLDKPANLSLEVNGDRLRNLHIFANALQSGIPDRNAPDVMWFDAGFHKPAGDDGFPTYRIPSNTTVYLAPGAVVNAKFLCDKAENVRFIGRGIILEAERGFELRHCKNIEIDGITVVNPRHYTVFGGEVDGLRIRGLKSFSCEGWSDGIDLMSCSNVTIDDIFMRNSDDCIAIYGHRWEFYGDARNYRITNAVLWADVAHPINIGLHGHVTDRHDGNTIEKLRFSGIDILQHDEDDRNYQGCIAFSVSDRNLVRDVVFEDVRVERIQEGQLINMRVLLNEKYCLAPGRGIYNVVFRNIFYDDKNENPGLIEGYSESCPVEEVTFENVVVNGKKVKSIEQMNLRVGPFTRKIRVK